MKFTFFVISLMAFLPIARGQNFTDPGNSWFISQLNWDTHIVEEYQLKIGPDTVLNGYSYKTIIRNDYHISPDWYTLNSYVREDAEKRVYLLDSNGTEGILYHFGLAIGEQVELVNGFAKLLSIDSVLVSNNQLQPRYRVKIMTLDSTCWTSAKWIDGIGDVGPLHIEYCNTPLYYALGCFLRNEELYWPSESSYCTELITSTEAAFEFPLNIFPNPVNDILTIQFEHEVDLPSGMQIFSMDGQLIFNVDVPQLTAQLDMSTLPPSMYLLKTTGKANKIIWRRIVKI